MRLFRTVDQVMLDGNKKGELIFHVENQGVTFSAT